jgi:hypothetical protein
MDVMAKSGQKNRLKNRVAKCLGITLGILVGALLLNTVRTVVADEGDDADTEAAPASSHRKGNFSRERVNKGDKETDGTTAANRFQAETVIKSQYKLDGEQLEVDPD